MINPIGCSRQTTMPSRCKIGGLTGQTTGDHRHRATANDVVLMAVRRVMVETATDPDVVLAPVDSVAGQIAEVLPGDPAMTAGQNTVTVTVDPVLGVPATEVPIDAVRKAAAKTDVDRIAERGKRGIVPVIGNTKIGGRWVSIATGLTSGVRHSTMMALAAETLDSEMAMLVAHMAEASHIAMAVIVDRAMTVGPTASKATAVPGIPSLAAATSGTSDLADRTDISLHIAETEVTTVVKWNAIMPDLLTADLGTTQNTTILDVVRITKVRMDIARQWIAVRVARVDRTPVAPEWGVPGLVDRAPLDIICPNDCWRMPTKIETAVSRRLNWKNTSSRDPAVALRVLHQATSPLRNPPNRQRTRRPTTPLKNRLKRPLKRLPTTPAA